MVDIAPKNSDIWYLGSIFLKSRPGNIWCNLPQKYVYAAIIDFLSRVLLQRLERLTVLYSTLFGALDRKSVV